MTLFKEAMDGSLCWCSFGCKLFYLVIKKRCESHGFSVSEATRTRSLASVEKMFQIHIQEKTEFFECCKGKIFYFRKKFARSKDYFKIIKMLNAKTKQSD